MNKIVIIGDTKYPISEISEYLAVRFDLSFLEVNRFPTLDEFKNINEQIIAVKSLDVHVNCIKDNSWILCYYLTDSAFSGMNCKGIPLLGNSIEQKIDRVMEQMRQDGFVMPEYEIWFRENALQGIKEKELRTIVRPGIRLLPNPKGSFRGQYAKARIIIKPGTKKTLPKFHEFNTWVKLESIQIKPIEKVRQHDLAGAADDCDMPEKIFPHLSSIYQTTFDLTDWVSIIRLAYMNQNQAFFRVEEDVKSEAIVRGLVELQASLLPKTKQTLVTLIRKEWEGDFQKAAVLILRQLVRDNRENLSKNPICFAWPIPLSEGDCWCFVDMLKEYNDPASILTASLLVFGGIQFVHSPQIALKGSPKLAREFLEKMAKLGISQETKGSIAIE